MTHEERAELRRELKTTSVEVFGGDAAFWKTFTLSLLDALDAAEVDAERYRKVRALWEQDQLTAHGGCGAKYDWLPGGGLDRMVDSAYERDDWTGRPYGGGSPYASLQDKLGEADARAALAEAQARVMADKLAQCYHREFEQAPYCPNGDPYECSKGLADKFADGDWSPPEPECVECWAAWAAREAGGSHE